MKDTLIQSLRKIALPILKRFGRDISIKHHFTGDKLTLHSYLHKGYWFHGKNRELETIALFQKYIKKGDTIIEVGGHIGYMTLLFNGLTGPNGQVVVFEPGQNNIPYIKQNIAPKKNISLIEKGVGNQNMITSFFIDNLTGQNNSFVEDFKGFEANKKAAFDNNAATKAVEVEIIRLDTFMASEIGPQKVDFIKIDVEGFEFEVLDGARSVLKKYLPIIMVEVQLKQGEVADLLHGIGYDTFDEAGNKLTRQDIESFASNNIFAIPGNKQ